VSIEGNCRKARRPRRDASLGLESAVGPRNGNSNHGELGIHLLLEVLVFDVAEARVVRPDVAVKIGVPLWEN
jgi:hypothetical protein